MGWYAVAAVIGVLLFQYFWTAYTQIETIPYSQFEQLLAEDKITEVTVGADSIEGTLKEPLPSGKRSFFVVRVDPRLPWPTWPVLMYPLLSHSRIPGGRCTIIREARSSTAIKFWMLTATSGFRLRARTWFAPTTFTSSKLD